MDTNENVHNQKIDSSLKSITKTYSSSEVKTNSLNDADWQFHCNWLSITIVSVFLLEFNIFEIDSRCYSASSSSKKIIHHATSGIAALSIFFTLLFSLIWTYSLKTFHIGKFATKFAFGLGFIAFVNLVFMCVNFLTRSCFELNLIHSSEYQVMSSLRKIIVKYDTKIAGIYELFISILSVSSCLYVTKIRTYAKLSYLERKGLIQDYFNEMKE